MTTWRTCKLIRAADSDRHRGTSFTDREDVNSVSASHPLPEGDTWKLSRTSTTSRPATTVPRLGSSSASTR
jgi:hypothetical protein